MRTICLLTAVAALSAMPASAQSARIVTEEMMVPSDPGIEIDVRNKRPADMTPFRLGRTKLQQSIYQH